jgi:SAM-dependent methyltransferase
LRAPIVIRTATSSAAIRIGAGTTELVLRDGGVSGRWRFESEESAILTVDFLKADPFAVPGAVVKERPACEGFIPAPRIRVEINGVSHEIVSSAGAVLERHYARPDHQVIYAAAEPWIEAYHEARRRQCRRLLKGVAGRVCDVGSGYSMVRDTGPWPFALVACDRDPGAVAALREWGVEAHVGDAAEPPFPNGDFDAVYAGEIVEHLPRPHDALRRWVELLKPNGRLLVTTPNRRHLLTRLRGFELVENPEHLFEWDARELRCAISDAGAEIDSLEGLALPLPVYVPGRGWRDLTPAALRRFRSVPKGLIRVIMELGRPLPSLAANLAVSAHRVR